MVQNPEGQWIEGPALDWETLPPRVEAVIAERIGRLPQPLRDALQAASVEGETFTAEVVARVRAADEREMVGRLSGELDRRHRLVRAQGILRIDGQRLSRYRFRHILFQKYVYNSLDKVERVHLHEAAGTALEALYGEGAEEIAAIAPQLARHFQEAGITEKAIDYLRRAGNRAVRLSANEEAIAHFTRGLALLETWPDTPERAQGELALRLALAAPLQATKGYAAPEVGRAYGRARELCQQIGETHQLFPTLWLLNNFYALRGEYQTAIELGEQMLRLAQRAQDPLLVAVGHLSLGWVLVHLGEFTSARAHLEHMIAFYDPQQHRSLAFIYGHDHGVTSRAWEAWPLWFLGYPDQALKRSREALALAQELDHPFTLAFALSVAGAGFHLYRREVQATQELNERLIRLSAEEGLVFYRAIGTIQRGWLQTEAGQVDEGIAQMIEGAAIWQARGTMAYRVFCLALLAEAYGKAGKIEEGLSVLPQALDAVEKTGERYWAAELYRLKGELLLMQGDETEAEASFGNAIGVARQQSAKSWELRATVSLSRLWQKQGKREEARQMLAEVYGWFTEGFDTPDLKDAKALLAELS